MAEKNVKMCICTIPNNVRELKFATNDELLSCVHNVPVKISKPLNEVKQMVFNSIKGTEIYDVMLKKHYDVMKEYREVDYRDNYGKTLDTEMVYEKKRIYLIGPCIVNAGCVFANQTLASKLLNLVSKNEYTIICVAYTAIQLWSGDFFESIPIRENDIVLWINEKNIFDKVKGIDNWLDCKLVFDNQNRDNYFIGWEPIHTNEAGNIALADYIYEKWLKDNLSDDDIGKYIQRGEVLSENLKNEIFEYTAGIINDDWSKESNIGAIVMNCNPFTLGHQYLIEYASSKVDYLYIFVVQEDKSYFPFTERFEMVVAGTSHLTNVKVVPSGNYVLSYKTVPTYFEKETKKDAVVDAQLDLEIFARYIAKDMGINIRFVGEEPIDKVTAQYNVQMKQFLQEWDISVDEIPRKKFDEEVISASRVREFIRKDNWDKIRNFVPVSTYNYLVNNQERFLR